MGIFGDLKTEGLEQAQDRLGGYVVHDTDIYKVTIKAAFAGQSAGGARSVTFQLAMASGEYSETIYITNKQGENWFLNQNDKSKKVPLPGFTTVNDICLVTTGKSLSEQDTEEKIVKIYDYDERKELPKAVQMLVDLVGQELHIGLLKTVEDKNVKNDSTGEYEPTGETVERNNIEKVFHEPSMMTVLEAEGGKTEGDFFQKWVDKNKGTVKNRSKGAKDGPQGGQTGRPGGAAPTSGAGNSGTKTTPSLFGKK